MAYTYSYTEWQDSDHLTYEDINRISANINAITENNALTTNYTQDDFLTVSNWTAIITQLANIIGAYGLVDRGINDVLTSVNLNNIEQTVAEAKEYYDLLHNQVAANQYAGQGFYSGEIYTRGI